MSDYKFLTIWQIDAPVSAVWDAINDVSSWPQWWRGVIEAVELRAGESDGIGSVHRTTWKSQLPYELRFESEVMRVEHHKLIEARATGELNGTGIWTFYPKGDATRVEYDWQVVTSKKWMDLLAPIARPFFEWNHDVIMDWGRNGLEERLRTTSPQVN